ncbi:MAG TPA: hypothetical protein VKU79_00260, partial [Thermoplasmataceae archaeon]|nr:hypothetical protein [Thermoplasmataceae archaeon]
MKVVGIGVADIRTEPKFESERDSQLIFGEEVNVLSDLGDYSLVDCGDRIRGYIKSTLITEGGKRKYKLKSFFSGETVKLPFGSYLSKDDVDRFNVPENLLVPIEKNDFDLISLAMKFLGVPYLWGGT